MSQGLFLLHYAACLVSPRQSLGERQILKLKAIAKIIQNDKSDPKNAKLRTTLCQQLESQPNHIMLLCAVGTICSM